jgi:L-asparagine transporter-like permease
MFSGIFVKILSIVLLIAVGIVLILGIGNSL